MFLSCEIMDAFAFSFLFYEVLRIRLFWTDPDGFLRSTPYGSLTRSGIKSSTTFQRIITSVQHLSIDTNSLGRVI